MEKIELRIVQLLADGLKQIDIPEQLKKEGFSDNSLGLVEKKIRKIKKAYKAKTTFHLAVILAKKGII